MAQTFVNKINGNPILASGIEFIVGTWSSATATWTGVTKESSLVDGKQILLYLPFAGANNVTLNLTLSGGTTTGAKNCYWLGTTRLSTHYAQYQIARLTYKKALSIGGTTYEGWWASDRDNNTTYSTLTQALVDTGTETTGKLITAKIVHDSILKGVKELPLLVDVDFNNFTDRTQTNRIRISYGTTGKHAPFECGECLLFTVIDSADGGGYQYALTSDYKLGCRMRFISTDGTPEDTWSTIPFAVGTDLKLDHDNYGMISVNTTGTASGTNAFVEGKDTLASGSYSHAEGENTQATDTATHAEGCSTKATKPHAHAEGYLSEASGGQSHAEGQSTKATNYFAHAEGNSTYATGIQSHSEGYGTLSGNQATHAEGSLTIASGLSAHAEGGATNALGKDSHSEGQGTKVATKLDIAHEANSNAWHVRNYESSFDSCYYLIAVDKDTHEILYVGQIRDRINSEIYTTTSSTDAYPVDTIIYGINNGALGYVSHSEGFQTLALGDYSHSEGLQTTASGMYSHTEGNHTVASGAESHAEGYGTSASGSYSHAEGNTTIASGAQSHAEGYDNTASGDFSHVEGIGTQAGSNGMHAAGMYNATTTGLARVTGWGTSSTRKDIEKLDTSGNLWLAGSISADNTSICVSPGGTFGNGAPTVSDIQNAIDNNATINFRIVEYYNSYSYIHIVPAKVIYHDNGQYIFSVSVQLLQYMAMINFAYMLGKDNNTWKWYYWLSQQGGAATWVPLTTAGAYGTPVANGYTYQLMIARDLKVDLSSGNAQSFNGNANATSIGVAGTLPVSKGGTGKTTAKDASNNFLVSLDSGSDDVWSTDFIIGSSHSNNATDTTAYVRRTGGMLWNFIKTQLASGSDKTIKSTSTSNDGGFRAEHGTSGKWVGFLAKRSDTGVAVDIEVGSGGVNHGLWSNQLNSGSGNWMIYATDDGKGVYFGGLLQGILNLNNSDGVAAVTNGATAGGTIAAGALRLTGTSAGSHRTVIDKSSSFTVSTSDISNCANGQIFIYRNTGTSPLTVTWTYKSGTTASGTVYVGCSAMFYLVHKVNGYFTRIA